MCSQQMSNWRMSGHPFWRNFFCQKGTEKTNNFLTKSTVLIFYDEEFPLKWVSEHAQFCKKRTNPTFRLCWLCRMPPCISLFSHHEGVFEEFFFCWKKVLGIECFFPLQHIFSTFQGHVFALALVGTFKTTYSLIWSKIAAPMYRAKIYDMKFWGWEKGKKF